MKYENEIVYTLCNDQNSFISVNNGLLKKIKDKLQWDNIYKTELQISIIPQLKSKLFS